MLTAVFLIMAAFFSSALTAVAGLGGGMLLLAVMPMALPAVAVVPLHGVVQLSSNASRSLFASREVVWSILPSFIVGVCLGGLCGSRLVLSIPATYLPVLLGGFILLLTWLPQVKESLQIPGRFFGLGLAQGLLTMLLGATGPLNIPVLLRQGYSGGQVISTHALLMTIVHLSKVIAFGLLGFAFVRYLPLLGGMVVAVTVGSYIGTKVRGRISDRWLKKVIKWLVTLFALRMIVAALL